MRPQAGVFSLRVVMTGPHERIEIPASIPTVSNDTIRFLSGSFELGPENTWRDRWERILVSGATTSETQVFESHGHYVVSQRSGGDLVLDLYPAQTIVASIDPTALVKGDSVFHGPFVFVR